MYFKWLQQDNPVGTVERFPELSAGLETSVPGIYCIGDLTGVPLIKLAAESGHRIVDLLRKDARFQSQRTSNTDPEILDLVICGAGPAGVAAGLHAQKAGYRFVILEANRVFNTVRNFPEGKPIYVTPVDTPFASGLTFSDGTKESLLAQLESAAASNIGLPLHEDERVEKIEQTGTGFTVRTSKSQYSCLRVIVAIGKSGDPRRLSVPGEERPKVFSRIIDPAAFSGKKVLVVGGGDSAVEAAIGLAQAGNAVTLSYRGEVLARPKPENKARLAILVRTGSVAPLFGSSVISIGPTSVRLSTPNGPAELENDFVYVLIGTQPPVRFLKQSNIRMRGEKRFLDWVGIAGLLLLTLLLCFGKKAPSTPVSSMMGFLSIPLTAVRFPWPQATETLLAWIGAVGLIVLSPFLLAMVIRQASSLRSKWHSFKLLYLILIFAILVCCYVWRNLAGRPFAGFDTEIWYTSLYSTTVLFFGIRRMAVRRTGYISRQTLALIIIQLIPLFILPVMVLPWLGQHGYLGGWIARDVFPGQSYWRAYGLVLAWPLFIHNLASGQPLLFWLIVSLLQTFVIIPLIVQRWGKGAYCGWICSCGGLAETLGDEYREGALHGKMPKKLDNVGQIVLWFAVVTTALTVLSTWFDRGTAIAVQVRNAYSLIVDIGLSGILGLGVYFALSGRFWCRFFCPLAAYMHIFARLSKYRIAADKKRCISCGICTRVCHMGIDVMGYANKGIPMNDVECVRCSACIVSCPLQVLRFGHTSTIDLDNKEYHTRPVPTAKGWRNGLSTGQASVLARTLTDGQPGG
jgi:NosR/NirI family transcriptional regulator, nitrous oxide reductase regulator